MKKFFSVIIAAVVAALMMSVQVLAGQPYAYFEGEDQTVTGALDKILAGLDAKMLMGNWYIIIIGVVVFACIIGINVSYIRGIVRFVRKKKAAKVEPQV